MRIFHIEESNNSPRVWLDEKSGTMEISGVSSFRSPFDFYRCLARWIHAFNLGEHKTRVVNMKLDYLDEDSMEGIEFVLQQLFLLGKDNNKLIINWYYSVEDSLMQMVGMRYAVRGGVRFNLVAA
ncbi:MAG: SiaC family regulatory phosphoprotein [Bacteroidales bacterium]|nr:SiaC family regulatory phosphoprotein [Bacteroidales bacterium]